MATPTKINGPVKDAKLLGKKFGLNAPATTGPHPVKAKPGVVMTKLGGHTGPTVKRRRGTGQNDSGDLV